MFRRLVLPVLTGLLLIASVLPAWAAHHRARFLHYDAPLDRVAVRGGPLIACHNEGHGYSFPAPLPRGADRSADRLEGVDRLRRADEGFVWGDRYDAAVPRAPAVAAVVPVALVGAPSIRLDPPVAVRPLSGRAPPTPA